MTEQHDGRLVDAIEGVRKDFVGAVNSMRAEFTGGLDRLEAKLDKIADRLGETSNAQNVLAAHVEAHHERSDLHHGSPCRPLLELEHRIEKHRNLVLSAAGAAVLSLLGLIGWLLKWIFSGGTSG